MKHKTHDSVFINKLDKYPHRYKSTDCTEIAEIAELEFLDVTEVAGIASSGGLFLGLYTSVVLYLLAPSTSISCNVIMTGGVLLSLISAFGLYWAVKRFNKIRNSESTKERQDINWDTWVEQL